MIGFSVRLLIMASKQTITINRAPVLTLWAAVVAERLGYDHDAALTLGKALAGLNAQSKGRRLGIYEPGEEKPRDKAEKRPARQRGEELRVEVCGRPVPARKTSEGVRAVVGTSVIKPKAVESYLRRSFGEGLPIAREAMERLAQSFQPEALEREAYGLYEQFRPQVPAGKRGWGAQGELDLNRVRSLAASQ